MEMHRDNIAKRKCGDIPGWEPFFWEVIAEHLILIEGGIPKVVGGKKKWPEDETQKCVVSQAEIAEEYRRYETETGKCGECFGEGKVYAGWNHETGVRYKLCPKCQIASCPQNGPTANTLIEGQ
jgi:hypothetical protein